MPYFIYLLNLYVLGAKSNEYLQKVLLHQVLLLKITCNTSAKRTTKMYTGVFVYVCPVVKLLTDVSFLWINCLGGIRTARSCKFILAPDITIFVSL